LSGRREKALAVANVDHFSVPYLSVGSAGHHFEQVAIGSDGRWRNMPKFFPGHVLFLHDVMNPIDLDFVLVVLVVMFTMLMVLVMMLAMLMMLPMMLTMFVMMLSLMAFTAFGMVFAVLVMRFSSILFAFALL
jgi:hypothetical protein